MAADIPQSVKHLLDDWFKKLDVNDTKRVEEFKNEEQKLLPHHEMRILRQVRPVFKLFFAYWLCHH